MVGFFIGDNNYQSRVQFGGYDPFYIKPGKENEGYGIHWYPLKS